MRIMEWECPFCGDDYEAPQDDLKGMGKAHLKQQHFEEMERLFRNNAEGYKCYGGCGNRLSFDLESAEVFVCPDCGRDHFSQYAGQKVYAEAKVVS